MIAFSLGSNLGNRLENLRNAVNFLSTAGLIISRSNVYETPAWGGVPQPDYLNACLTMEINKNPFEILKFVKALEIKLGRVPSARWSARKIDIDIIFYEHEIVNAPELKIPHENLHNRAFVLVPLNEILPEYVHPILNISVRELLKNFADEKLTRVTNL